MRRLRGIRARAVDPEQQEQAAEATPPLANLRRANFNIPPPPRSLPPGARIIPPEEQGIGRPAPAPASAAEIQTLGPPPGEPSDFYEEALTNPDARLPPYPILENFRRTYGDENETGIPDLFIVTPHSREQMLRERGRFVPNGLIHVRADETYRFAPHLQHGETTTIAHTNEGLRNAKIDELFKFRGNPNDSSHKFLYTYQIDPDFVKRSSPVRLRDFLENPEPVAERPELYEYESRALRDETEEFINQLPLPNLTEEEAPRIIRDFTYEDPTEDRNRNFLNGFKGEGAHERSARFNIGLAHELREFHLDTPFGIPVEELRLSDINIMRNDVLRGIPSYDLRSILFISDDPQRRTDLIEGEHDAAIPRTNFNINARSEALERIGYANALRENIPPVYEDEIFDLDEKDPNPATYADLFVAARRAMLAAAPAVAAPAPPPVAPAPAVAAPAPAPADDDSDDSGEFGF